MVLMSLVDGIILGIVLIVVSFLVYHLFIKKERSHCSGCAAVALAKKKKKGMLKFYKKQNSN